MEKNKLTSGERIMRSLIGQPVDRAPFGVGIGWQPWGETYERWKKESGKQDLDLELELGYDANSAIPGFESGIFPLFEEKVISEDGDLITFRDRKGITMRGRKDGGSMPEFLDYPVKNIDDWEKLKAERLNAETPARITENWPEFKERIKKNGQAIQVGDFPFGVFGTPRDLMGAEELLVSFYSQPEMVRDMMDHLTSLWIALWEKVSKEIQIDHIHIWEDMSGRQGSLISPKMVEEFMMPCYDRIAAFGKAHGVRVISVDTDGDCGELVPVMIKHGVNMFFPFEVQAGNDILKYRKLYPKLGIVGGLDKRALAGTKADIDKEIKKSEEMLKSGYYVPGFDHLIPPDVSWDNFRYAAAKMKEVCYKAKQ